MVVWWKAGLDSRVGERKCVFSMWSTVDGENV